MAATTETTWVELGRWAKSTRTALQMAQADLAAYGGPSETTVRRIERAELPSLRDQTRRQLERALGWPHGIVDHILDGADVTDTLTAHNRDAAARAEVRGREAMRAAEILTGRGVGTAGPALTGRALVATRAAGLIAELAQLDDRTGTETTALRALAALVHELADDQPPTPSVTGPMHSKDHGPDGVG